MVVKRITDGEAFSSIKVLLPHPFVFFLLLKRTTIAQMKLKPYWIYGFRFRVLLCWVRWRRAPKKLRITFLPLLIRFPFQQNKFLMKCQHSEKLFPPVASSVADFFFLFDPFWAQKNEKERRSWRRRESPQFEMWNGWRHNKCEGKNYIICVFVWL